MHLKLFWKIGEFCKISEVENKAKSFYTRFFKENKFESHLLRQLSNDIVKLAENKNICLYLQYMVGDRMF